MANNDYFNTLLIRLNDLEYEYDVAIREIQKGNRIEIKNDNPAKFLRDSVYNLKAYYDDRGFNLFDGDNYLKFAYLAFIDAIIEEIAMCLGNMLNYSSVGLLERLRNRNLVLASLKNYAVDFVQIKMLKAEHLSRYIKVLLSLDRDFENFKPGMLYKYIVLITNELKEIGIDFTKDEFYIDIMNIIRAKELKLQDEVLDIESFDKALSDMSIKYNVDFERLDKKYGYRIIEDPEEVKKHLN